MTCSDLLEGAQIIKGPQPLSTNFFSSPPGQEQRWLASGAVWEGEFYVLNKLKNVAAGFWCGGLIKGTFPASTTPWERMHDAYAFSLDNAAETTIREVRIHNTGDGVSLKGVCDQFILDAIHMSYVRDDAVQNDFGAANGLVNDCLVDGCYSFFSSRPFDPNVADHSQAVTQIEGNLVYLKDMPTVFNRPGVSGHAKFFKMDNANQVGWPGHPRDPKLSLINNIMRLDTRHVTNTDFMIPPLDRCDTVSGNIMVWGGQGPFPYQSEVVTGWTVTTDLSVWDNAKAAWLANHPGVAQQYPSWP